MCWVKPSQAKLNGKTPTATHRLSMHSKVKEYCELTLRVLFRIMHGEEQREGGADRLFTTATQAAVLHFTSKEFTDCRLARGTQRTVITDTTKTNEWWHLRWTCFCKNFGPSELHTQSRGCHKALFRKNICYYTDICLCWLWPAAGSPVGLRALLLLCLLVQLGEDEAVPALD